MSGLKIGDRIPDFKLLNQDGNWVYIRKYIGKPMIIYFYPKDDTAGCTKEACTFRDEFHHFAEQGVTVFGISADTVKSHYNFKKKYRLPFDLLVDTGNRVRDAFGVKADLFGLIPGRVTYVIDAKGIIRSIYSSQMNVTKHVSEALSAIEKM